MNPYEKSVAKLLEKFSKHHFGSPAPRWLPHLLRRYATAIPARYPMQPVAVTGVHVNTVNFDFKALVYTRLLVQSGWSPEVSLMMFKNFKLAYPDTLFEPEVMRLLTRKQLQETYGGTFGNVLADMCINTDSQPLFWALLTGDLDREVARPMMHVFTSLEVDMSVVPNDAETLPRNVAIADNLWNVVPGGSLTEQRDPPKMVPYADAALLYKDATGCEADFTCNLNPREIDYEALALAGQAVWQIDGDGREQP